MKICIAASAGGHITELNQLLPALSGHDFFYITFFMKGMTDDLPAMTYHVINPDIRNPKLGPMAFIINIFQTLRILMKERPDVILTSGATVAFTVCYLAKFLLGSKILYIETGSRIVYPSLIGRLLHPITDFFLVQWKHILKFYPKAIYGGQLL